MEEPFTQQPTEYIDKGKFKMHIVMKNSRRKIQLTDEERDKFLQILDEVSTVTIKDGD